MNSFQVYWKIICFTAFTVHEIQIRMITLLSVWKIALFYSQANIVEILQKFSPCYDFHELAQQPREGESELYSW